MVQLQNGNLINDGVIQKPNNTYQITGTLQIYK